MHETFEQRLSSFSVCMVYEQGHHMEGGQGGEHMAESSTYEYGHNGTSAMSVPSQFYRNPFSKM